MTPEQQKAKEILIKYISIIGSECEHDSYCDRPECNKLGYTFCHVDYKTAKACAIEEVRSVINVIADLHIIADSEGIMKSMIYHENVLTEIEKM